MSDDAKKRAKQIIQEHVGADDPITSRELSDKLSNADEVGSFPETRSLIREIVVEDRIPIASSGNGYLSSKPRKNCMTISTVWSSASWGSPNESSPFSEPQTNGTVTSKPTTISTYCKSPRFHFHSTQALPYPLNPHIVRLRAANRTSNGGRGEHELQQPDREQQHERDAERKQTFEMLDREHLRRPFQQ